MPWVFCFTCGAAAMMLPLVAVLMSTHSLVRACCSKPPLHRKPAEAMHTKQGGWARPEAAGIWSHDHTCLLSPFPPCFLFPWSFQTQKPENGRNDRLSCSYLTVVLWPHPLCSPAELVHPFSLFQMAPLPCSLPRRKAADSSCSAHQSTACRKQPLSAAVSCCRPNFSLSVSHVVPSMPLEQEI